MAKANPAKPAAKAPVHPVFEKAAEEAVAKRNRTSPNFPPEATIEWLTDANPKREGSKSFERFAAYMGKDTVGEYIAAGGTYGDLKYDAEHGFIKVEGFDAVVKERKERAPKAEGTPKRRATDAEGDDKPAPVKRKGKPAPAVVEAEEETEE